jgi:hypothetical protein
MISYLPESSGNNLGFLIDGKLTDEDYKQTLIPAMDKAIESSEKLRILFQMENFDGWTAHGAWDDFTCCTKIGSIERMSIVVGENWHDFATWLFTTSAKIAHIEIKFFPMKQLPDAWEWLKEE